jgi:hypothetical protein
MIARFERKMAPKLGRPLELFWSAYFRFSGTCHLAAASADAPAC